MKNLQNIHRFLKTTNFVSSLLWSIILLYVIESLDNEIVKIGLYLMFIPGMWGFAKYIRNIETDFLEKRDNETHFKTPFGK